MFGAISCMPLLEYAEMGDMFIPSQPFQPFTEKRSKRLRALGSAMPCGQSRTVMGNVSKAESLSQKSTLMIMSSCCTPSNQSIAVALVYET